MSPSFKERLAHSAPAWRFGRLHAAAASPATNVASRRASAQSASARSPLARGNVVPAKESVKPVDPALAAAPLPSVAKERKLAAQLRELRHLVGTMHASNFALASVRESLRLAHADFVSRYGFDLGAPPSAIMSYLREVEHSQERARQALEDKSEVDVNTRSSS